MKNKKTYKNIKKASKIFAVLLSLSVSLLAGAPGSLYASEQTAEQDTIETMLAESETSDSLYEDTESMAETVIPEEAEIQKNDSEREEAEIETDASKEPDIIVPESAAELPLDDAEEGSGLAEEDVIGDSEGSLVQEEDASEETAGFIKSIYTCKVKYSVTATGTYMYSLANDALKALNEWRAENGLPAITMDEKKQQVAMERAMEMSVFFDHYSLTHGADIYKGLPESAYEIAYGTTQTKVSGQYFIDGFKSSSGHRPALTCDDTHDTPSTAVCAGIGIYKSKGGAYFCVIHQSAEHLEAARKHTDTEVSKTFQLPSEAFDIVPGDYTYDIDPFQIKVLGRPYADGAVYGAAYAGITHGPGFYDIDNSLLYYESLTPEVFKVSTTGKVTPVSAGSGKCRVYLRSAMGTDEEIYSDVSVNIPTVNISDVGETMTVSSKSMKCDFTGSAAYPSDLVVKWYNPNTKSYRTMKEGTDYYVSSAGEEMGYANLSITGKGFFEGTRKNVLKNYHIVATMTNSNTTIKLKESSAAYDGKIHIPVISSVTYKGPDSKTYTVYSTDYEVKSDGQGKDPGTYTVKITGTGESFSGTVSTTFRINAAPTATPSPKPTVTPKVTAIPKVTVTPKATVTPKPTVTPAVSKEIGKAELSTKYSAYEYEGHERYPNVIVEINGTVLTKGTDYTLKYKNNKEVGTATYTVTGIGSYTGTKSGSFRITKKNVSSASVRTKSGSYKVTGYPRKPEPIVMIGNRKLTKERDYTLAYSNNTEAGTATVTVNGTGNYTGTASATFELVEYKLIPIYRLYNPGTGEHFYTKNLSERNACVKNKWRAEGIAWYAPEKSAYPVYRVCNPHGIHMHHYTISRSERDWLVRLGWRDEGISFYSSGTKENHTGVPVYRLYNPNSAHGDHHYTKSKSESDFVENAGWRYEGICWYVFKQP